MSISARSWLGLMAVMVSLLTATPAWAQAPAIPADQLARIKAATVYVKVEWGKTAGTGSGFLVRGDATTGWIVTNDHVVTLKGQATGNDKPTVSVVFHSGTRGEWTAPAEIVSRDPERDLAMLRIRPTQSLPAPLPLNGPIKLPETTTVYVCGFPFGDLLAAGDKNPEISIGQATVSSNRSDDHDEVVMVQLNGALNPGNSGGPVVTAEGKLVGVAVATVKGAGLGLAIPHSHVSDMIRGRVSEPIVIRPKIGAAEVWVLGRVIDPMNKIKSPRAFLAMAGAGKDKEVPPTDLSKRNGTAIYPLAPLSDLPHVGIAKLEVPANITHLWVQSEWRSEEGTAKLGGSAKVKILTEKDFEKEPPTAIAGGNLPPGFGPPGFGAPPIPTPPSFPGGPGRPNGPQGFPGRPPGFPGPSFPGRPTSPFAGPGGGGAQPGQVQPSTPNNAPPPVTLSPMSPPGMATPPGMSSPPGLGTPPGMATPPGTTAPQPIQPFGGNDGGNVYTTITRDPNGSIGRTFDVKMILTGVTDEALPIAGAGRAVKRLGFLDENKQLVTGIRIYLPEEIAPRVKTSILQHGGVRANAQVAFQVMRQDSNQDLICCATTVRVFDSRWQAQRTSDSAPARDVTNPNGSGPGLAPAGMNPPGMGMPPGMTAPQGGGFNQDPAITPPSTNFDNTPAPAAAPDYSTAFRIIAVIGGLGFIMILGIVLWIVMSPGAATKKKKKPARRPRDDDDDDDDDYRPRRRR